MSKIILLPQIGISILILFVLHHFFFGQIYIDNGFALGRNSTLQREINNNISLNPTSKYANSIQSSLLPLVLLEKIPLLNVNGRIDHMDIDIKNHRLFVAELENNSVDILDLHNNGKRLKTITDGIVEPQGIAFVPKLDKLFVSNGGDGKVNIFNATTYRLIDSIDFHNDADNIRYDNISKLIYVGYGQGNIGIINVTNDNLLKEIQLPAHPESFQIEINYASLSNKLPLNGAYGRIFVNTPDDNSISIINTTSDAVSKWHLLQDNIHGNFPMALDQANHRLFVGTRDPPKLVVFDTNSSYSGSGKIISKVNIDSDPDDIFYDSLNKIIYISCGEGFIDVFKQQDANHYSLIGKIPTKAGARTSLFVPELKRIYLAVPNFNANNSSNASILVYGYQ